MSDDDNGPVSREDFDSLWQELVSFRQTSAELETALTQQIDDHQKEIRRLTRALRDEQTQKEHWEETSRELRAKEANQFEDRSKESTELQELRLKLRALEDEQAAVRRVEGGNEVALRRLTEERNSCMERAIIAESTLEETQEALQEAQKEVRQLRELLAEAKQQTQQQQRPSEVVVSSPVSKNGPTLREIELEQAMVAIATRAKQIFELCQQKLVEQGKPPLKLTSSVDLSNAAASASASSTRGGDVVQKQQHEQQQEASKRLDEEW